MGAHARTLKASKMLALWREQGLLVPLPGRGKRNMAYTKPAQAGEQPGLLSEAEENNRRNVGKRSLINSLYDRLFSRGRGKKPRKR